MTELTSRTLCGHCGPLIIEVKKTNPIDMKDIMHEKGTYDLMFKNVGWIKRESLQTF